MPVVGPVNIELTLELSLRYKRLVDPDTVIARQLILFELALAAKVGSSERKAMNNPFLTSKSNLSDLYTREKIRSSIKLIEIAQGEILRIRTTRPSREYETTLEALGGAVMTLAEAIAEGRR